MTTLVYPMFAQMGILLYVTGLVLLAVCIVLWIFTPKANKNKKGL